MVNIKKIKKNWIHLKINEDSHGCKNHPSKDFLNTKEFKDIVCSEKLFEISKKILKTENAKLSPRMIVKVFQSYPKDVTYAHRDKEYFKSQNPNNVATCWIPLGQVGPLFGQLIHLLGSQFKESKIDKLVNSEKIITKDLGDLSKNLNLNWIRPIIEEGDVIYHSLEIVHASFDSSSNIPRLSIDLRFSASAKIMILDGPIHGGVMMDFKLLGYDEEFLLKISQKLDLLLIVVFGQEENMQRVLKKLLVSYMEWEPFLALAVEWLLNWFAKLSLI